jgi:hypothetical protein
MSKLCGVLDAAERRGIAVCKEFLVTGSKGVSRKAHNWLFSSIKFSPEDGSPSKGSEAPVETKIS